METDQSERWRVIYHTLYGCQDSWKVNITGSPDVRGFSSEENIK